jgi:hypothetical protein
LKSATLRGFFQKGLFSKGAILKSPAIKASRAGGLLKTGSFQDWIAAGSVNSKGAIPNGQLDAYWLSNQVKNERYWRPLFCNSWLGAKAEGFLSNPPAREFASAYGFPRRNGWFYRRLRAILAAACLIRRLLLPTGKNFYGYAA